MKPMKMKKTTMMMRTIKHMQITTIVFINNGQRIINDLVKYMIQKMTNHVQQQQLEPKNERNNNNLVKVLKYH